MNTIDFLPDRYRQATSRRRTSYWRLIVTILFVGAFAATAYAMHGVRGEARLRHEQVVLQLQAERQAASAVKPQAARLEHLERYASLLTFMRHPWPRSRIVAAVLGSLPASATLEKFRIVRVAKPPTPGEAPVADESAVASAADAATDLKALRREAETLDIVVQIQGLARDQADLLSYVQRLGDDDLIADAKLTSIEAAVGDRSADSDAANTAPAAAQFSVEIVVRPGWGLPGGPAESTLLDNAKEAP